MSLATSRSQRMSPMERQLHGDMQKVFIPKVKKLINTYNEKKYMSDVYSVGNEEVFLLYANRIPESDYKDSIDETYSEYANNILNSATVAENPSTTYVVDLNSENPKINLQATDNSKFSNYLNYLFYSLDCKYPVLNGLLNEPQITELNNRNVILKSTKLIKKFFASETEENFNELKNEILAGIERGVGDFGTFLVDYTRFQAFSYNSLSTINFLGLTMFYSKSNNVYMFKEAEGRNLKEEIKTKLQDTTSTMEDKKKLILSLITVAQAFRFSATLSQLYITVITKLYYRLINDININQQDINLLSSIRDLNLKFIKLEDNKIYFKSNLFKGILDHESFSDELKNKLSETYSKFDIYFIIDCNGTFKTYLYHKYEYNTSNIQYYLKYNEEASKVYLTNYILPDNSNVPLQLKTLRQYLYLKRYIIELYSYISKSDGTKDFYNKGLYSLLLINDITETTQIRNNRTIDNAIKDKYNHPMLYIKVKNTAKIPLSLNKELLNSIIRLDDTNVSEIKIDIEEIKRQLQIFVMSDIYFTKIQQYIQNKIKGIDLKIPEIISNNLIMYVYDGKLFMYVDAIDVLMDSVKQDGYKYTEDKTKKMKYYELLFFLKGIINLVCVIIDGDSIVFNRTNASHTGALMDLEYLVSVYLEKTMIPYDYYSKYFKGIKTGYVKQFVGIVDLNSEKRYEIVENLLKDPSNTDYQLRLETYNLFRLCLLPNMRDNNTSETLLKKFPKKNIQPKNIESNGLYFPYNRYLFITTFKGNEVLFDKEYTKPELKDLEEKLNFSSSTRVRSASNSSGYNSSNSQELMQQQQQPIAVGGKSIKKRTRKRSSKYTNRNKPKILKLNNSNSKGTMKKRKSKKGKRTLKR
jgi:hypothetical protein